MKPVLLSLFFCIFFTSFVYGESLRIAYAEFPPFTYTGKDGRAVGVFIETGRRVCRKLNIEIESEISYPPARLIDYIDRGEADLWYGIKRPSHADFSYSGSELIGEIEMNLYSVGKPPDVERKEDLSGKSIILLLGYSYSDWGAYIRDPDNNVNHYQVRTHRAGLMTLKRRKVDYLLDYTYPVNNTLKEVSVPGLMKKQISRLECFFILSQKKEGGKSLIKRLDQALKEIKAGRN